MIIYFDTETSGLFPGEICQLGYVLEDAERVERKNFFFEVEYVHPDAQAVTGLSVPLLRELSGGRKFRDAADEIGEDFLRAKLIVAHNFRFDYHFLQTEFNRLGKLFRYRQELCSMKYFTPVLKLPHRKTGGYKYPKLSELCDFFAVTKEEIESGAGGGFHNAVYDAEALYLCVKKAAESDEKLRCLIKESTEVS